MTVTPQAFVLDTNPEQAAKYYVDKDVMDYPSVLLDVLRAANSDIHPLRKHVLAKWASGRREYNWLYNLTRALLKEQTYRFNVTDEAMWDDLFVLLRGTQNADDAPSRFVQLTDVKIAGDAVKAYRDYYHRINPTPTWTKRGAPKWWRSREQLSLNL